MIGWNVRFGFAIEEPAILFYDSFIKDVFFSIDVSCVLKGGSQILMFNRAVTKYLLMFRRENEIRALNMDTIFDGALERIYFFVLIGRGAQRNKESEGLMILQVIKVGDICNVLTNKVVDVR